MTRHDPDHNSRVGLLIWGMIGGLAIAGAGITIFDALRPANAVTEAIGPMAPTQLIHDRVYWNTPQGDRYFFVSPEGAICSVNEAEWLKAILGEPYDCLWVAPQAPLGPGQD
jgi:hypothetical protein